MQVMAVAGNDEARDILLGHLHPDHPADGGARATPRTGACSSSCLRRASTPRSRAGAGCPTSCRSPEPDAWQPAGPPGRPACTAPTGELRGTLSIDCPTDGRRPDEAHRRILNRYAEQAARALYVAVEREAFADQVRVLSATREVVRNATRERNIGAMLEKIQPSLIEGFRCAGQLDPHLRRGRPRAGCHLRRRRGADRDAAAPGGDRRACRRRSRGGPSVSGLVSRHVPRDAGSSAGVRAGVPGDPAASSRTSASARCCSCRRRRPGVPGQPGADPGARRRGVDPGRGRRRARGRPRPGPGGAQRPRPRPGTRAGPRAQGARRLQEQAHRDPLPRAEEPAGGDARQHRVPHTRPSTSTLARSTCSPPSTAVPTRLVRVVEDLLLLAKVGDPHLPLLTRPVNLLDVVEDVVNLSLDRRPAPGQGGGPRASRGPDRRDRRPGRARHPGHQPGLATRSSTPTAASTVTRGALPRRPVGGAQLRGPGHRHRPRRPQASCSASSSGPSRPR